MWENMCIEVGLALKKDPIKIYYNWYLPQLQSVYAYVTNEKYKNLLTSSMIDEKDRAKKPEILVEQVLEKEEIEEYVKQRRSKSLKTINNL